MQYRKQCYLLLLSFFIFSSLNAQICGTPGLDGPANISVSINTYYPVSGDYILSSGGITVPLAAVPPNDPYGNNFGLKPISKGDLLLIIQMQDASINYTNDNLYGSNNASSGSDGLGGSGYIALGNTGTFEYVIATSDVPLTGGILRFKGYAVGGGTIKSYTNAAADPTHGGRTFQVVRVPQYSNLVLSNDIKTPPFNGKAGGIIAFDVSGTMDFNGFVIDASARGFRGGYGPVGESLVDISNLYVIPSSDMRSAGKGEGIAGTPRYMWDGFNSVNNNGEGLPGGSYGKGAPGNAGGGGNDHNAGGGGGANGGYGGVGGDGVSIDLALDTYPNGGRPGSITYDAVNPDITRLIMGGGGGGGDANNALDGVKGGVGGGIILINAGSIRGIGIIKANGSNGAVGIAGSAPDGAGGGGAGGTVYIKVNNPDPTAMLSIQANGGNGGNTERDGNTFHGPGGGGGGGQVFYSMPTTTVSVTKGTGGYTEYGSHHNAADGTVGHSKFFNITDLPPYLQGSGSGCYPELTTVMSEFNNGAVIYTGSLVTYIINVRNAIGGGNAGGVEVDVQLPAGFIYDSATAVLDGDSGGPNILTNNPNGTPNRPLLGDFNISPGDGVTITLIAKVDCGTAAGTYNASVQALYLDPSRTLVDPDRRITAQDNAFTDAKITYESSGGIVPGLNYDGNLSIAENITVNTISITGNTITAPSNTVYCDNGDPAPITGIIPMGAPDPSYLSYQWEESDNGIDFTAINGATAQDYDPQVITTTTYYRRQVLYLGCPLSSISNPIELQVVVEAIFDPLASVCQEALPFPLSGGREKFNIISGTGIYSGTGVDAQGIFHPAVAGPGTHTITYTFNADSGCSDFKTQDITVLPTPLVDAGADQTILEGGETKLMATASGSTLTYKWTPATGLDRDDIINPVASPITDITYTLTVSSDEGCSNVDQVRVKVLRNPEIPNAFSPNGDNINDEWNIKYLSTYPFATVTIYNRYGEKLFTANSKAKGWDGKYKGSDVPVGTYYYVLDPHNGRKTISGALTIIR